MEVKEAYLGGEDFQDLQVQASIQSQEPESNQPQRETFSGNTY